MEKILNIYFSSDIIKYCILPYLFNNTKGARIKSRQHKIVEQYFRYDMTHLIAYECITCRCTMFQSGIEHNHNINKKKCTNCKEFITCIYYNHNRH